MWTRADDAKMARELGYEVRSVPQVRCPKCGMTTSLSRAEEKLRCWGCGQGWVFPAAEAPPEFLTDFAPTPAYLTAPTGEIAFQVIELMAGSGTAEQIGQFEVALHVACSAHYSRLTPTLIVTAAAKALGIEESGE